MAISQQLARLKPDEQTIEHMSAQASATLPYAKFADIVTDFARHAAAEFCHGKRFDRFILLSERPAEYSGPQLRDEKNVAVYLYNIGRAEYGSSQSPGIIAVEICREGSASSVNVNSDQPNDELHQKIISALGERFSQVVTIKPAISARVGQFFVDQVSRLARQELSLKPRP